MGSMLPLEVHYSLKERQKIDRDNQEMLEGIWHPKLTKISLFLRGISKELDRTGIISSKIFIFFCNVVYDFANDAL